MTSGQVIAQRLVESHAEAIENLILAFRDESLSDADTLSVLRSLLRRTDRLLGEPEVAFAGRKLCVLAKTAERAYALAEKYQAANAFFDARALMGTQWEVVVVEDGLDNRSMCVARTAARLGPAVLYVDRS